MKSAVEAVECLATLPFGTSRGTAFGCAYVVSKTQFNNGKSCKFVAEELAGSDRVSFNIYTLSAGPQLHPCEMPVEKVLAFLRAFQPE